MAKKLCENCGREFEAKTKLVREVRYGSVREYEVEETLCSDCHEDMDIEDEEDGLDVDEDEKML